MKKISEKYFYFGIIILVAYLIFRFINEAKIITFFPLDYINDVSSFMAQLYFLAEFGFHGIVPYWYDGFKLFLAYYPGWFYFALPIYYLTSNVQLTWYLTLVIIYILTFLVFLLLAKIEKLSITQGFYFFLIFLANPLAIGNFIRLGRIAELFSWTFFVAFFILIIYYKHRDFDKRFYLLFILLYSSLILIHPMPLIFASVMLLSLLLIKSNKQRFIIIINFIIAAIITSFWWMPYVINLFRTVGASIVLTDILFIFNGRNLLGNVAGILTSTAFIVLFYLYYAQNNKKELRFYLPSIILAVLFLTRAIHYIPILNKIYPDSYTLYFLFLGLYIMFKIDFRMYHKLKYVVYSLLLLLPVIFVVVSIFYVPLFKEHGSLEEEFNSLMPYVEGKYIMYGSVYSTPSAKAYYAYNAIFHNLETPSGWSHQHASPDLYIKLSELSSFRSRDTEDFLRTSRDLGLKSIISFGDNCDYLASLEEFELIKVTENTCLYSLT